MSHTGIRLRVVLAGLGPVLEGDSDWLHMAAVFAGGLEVPDVGQVLAGQLPAYQWHQVMGGPVEIWVQPVMLPDDYPDDEEEYDMERENSGPYCNDKSFVVTQGAGFSVYCHLDAGHPVPYHESPDFRWRPGENAEPKPGHSPE